MRNKPSLTACCRTVTRLTLWSTNPTGSLRGIGTESAHMRDAPRAYELNFLSGTIDVQTPAEGSREIAKPGTARTAKGKLRRLSVASRKSPEQPTYPSRPPHCQHSVAVHCLLGARSTVRCPLSTEPAGFPAVAFSGMVSGLVMSSRSSDVPPRVQAPDSALRRDNQYRHSTESYPPAQSGEWAPCFSWLHRLQHSARCLEKSAH